MKTLIPRLVPGSQVMRLDDDSIVIRTWHRTLRIRGKSAAVAMAVLQASNGARSIAEIVGELGLSSAAIDQIFTNLRGSGVVQLLEPDQAPVRASMSYALDVASGNGDQQREGKVMVVGSGRAAELVTKRLDQLGSVAVPTASVEAVREGLTGHDALVFAEERMTYRDALEIDRLAAASEVPWCAGWWEGSKIVVSHEIRFGRSACFECLLERQRANYVQAEIDIRLEELLRNGTGTTAGNGSDGAAVPDVVSSLLADLLVLRAWSLASGGSASKRPGQLLEFDLAGLDLRWSTVLRLPSCRHCSPGVLHPPAVIA